jgi:hypothetical protein
MVGLEILNQIKEYFDDCHLEYPRIVTISELTGFQQQDCEMAQFDYELINQHPGGGISGDAYSGDMAFPLGDGKFLLVSYYF